MSVRPESISDPVFGDLEREEGFSDWDGRMPFPALMACQIRWQLAPDEESIVPAESVSQEVGRHAEVVIHDEAGDGPDDPQRAAYSLLVENQDQVAVNILSGLVVGMKHRSSFDGSPVQPDAERLGLVSVGGVQELVTLSDIHFLEESKEGESYVTFEFECCWDEEHGISLLVHHGRPIACGVALDFLNTEDLEADAKYCELPDLSPGVAVASPAAAGAKRYFELVAGSSRKFWEIRLSGSVVTTRWGRLGTDGQSKTKNFKDATAAKKGYDKLMAEKTRKGYTEK